MAIDVLLGGAGHASTGRGRGIKLQNRIFAQAVLLINAEMRMGDAQ